jgi:2-polyprenyl-6-methoxyphenol hydroxylase-like FAD-dependent oxidoreductase
MPDSQLDALIVGAGPVGLTAAAALNRHGLRCRIIDKAPAPSDKSKALVVWCRTLELLDQLGLATTFVATGLKINGGTIHANAKPVVHLVMRTDESTYGFPLMIPQNDTERLLTEHLAAKGVHVERQVELVSFDQRPDGVLCKLRHADGTEESCDVPWLLGCDGAHSTVRHTLKMEFTGAAEPNDWMLADVHLHGPVPEDEISAYWHDDGVLVIFPMGQSRFRMVADTGAATEGTHPPDPTIADVQAKINERGPQGVTVSDPIWLANFRINERKVTDYRQSRVLLAGDAAHIHSPAGGQGMNTGMQDAFNLAWKLALICRGQGQSEPLLKSYSVERSAVGDQVLHNAERFTTVATLRNPTAQWIRNHLAPIVGSFHFVQDKIKNQFFELSINYRESPITADNWPALTGGLAAGDRLCDAPITPVSSGTPTTAGGTPTTLFATLNPSEHTLLLLPGTSHHAGYAGLLETAESIRSQFPGLFSTHAILTSDDSAKNMSAGPNVTVWLDTTGRIHEKLHAKEPTLIWVRPDQYIGYRSQPADAEALAAYFQRYLLSSIEK